MANVNTKRLLQIASILLVLAFGACTTGRAYFSWSNDVSGQFENGRVLKDHKYYYGGPDAKPNAIVAIHNTYNLKSPYWHALEVTPESLRKLVNHISNVLYAEYKITPKGARILLQKGEQVGVWYSFYDYPQVKVTGDGQLYLGSPEPKLPADVRSRRID